ncbi:MAG: hypothetical protein RLZZ616_707, partial [Pseudomonadota bacterium]
QWLGIGVILLSLFLMKLPARPFFKRWQARRASTVQCDKA